MKVCPTEFEITDGGITLLARVKLNDEHTCTVELPDPIGLSEWRLLRDVIDECMRKMLEAAN